MELHFTGSVLGWWALVLGCVFLVLRWVNDAKRASFKRIWPIYFADALALLILVVLVLQPVWEKKSYRFSKPEIWLALDQSHSFHGGKTLGMDSLVAREFQSWSRDLQAAGFDIKTFTVTGRTEETSNPFDDLPEDDRQWSSLGSLTEAAALASRSVAAILYFGDGRDHFPPGQSSRHGTNSIPMKIPLYFPAFNQVPFSEAQLEAFEWQGEKDPQGLPQMGLLKWRALGVKTQSVQACLVAEEKTLGCWDFAVDAAAKVGKIQLESIQMGEALRPFMKNAKRMFWLMRPLPEAGLPDNDTLFVTLPGNEARPVLVWPSQIPSLDVTVLLRLLAMDSTNIRFGQSPPISKRVMRVAYAPVQGPDHKEDGQRLDLWVQPPVDKSFGANVPVPGPAWKMQSYSKEAKLNYSPESRRFLPSALGTLADLSHGPLDLPDAEIFSPCFLQAVERENTGCLVGWLLEAKSEHLSGEALSQGRFYWALPRVWNKVFSEAGDAVLERRVKQIGIGLLRWMTQMRFADTLQNDHPMANSARIEMQKLGQDEERLQEIATASGGRRMDVSQGNTSDTVALRALDFTTSKHEVGAPELERQALELDFALFSFLVGLLGASWYGRKRFLLS
jgi:hypothetical protein